MVEKKLSDLKKAKESGDKDSIKSSMEELTSAWTSVVSKINQDSQEKPKSNSGAKSDTKEKPKQEQEIEDADFEVVD